MGKSPALAVERRPPSRNYGLRLKVLVTVAFLACISWIHLGPDCKNCGDLGNDESGVWGSYRSPYGQFPLPDDSFHFLPCTNTTIPPPLEDPHPERTWGKLFDPNPDHWSWGNKSTTAAFIQENGGKREDPHDGQGIYLCGYLDVPLDYTNQSDARIVRLAVTKFQASGLALTSGTETFNNSSNDGTTAAAAAAEDRSAPGTGSNKSKRTIIIEPGGPGGSGTSFAWREAENISKRLSDGALDVLGWDPRGVNATQPSVSCYPHDAGRDRWRLVADQHLAVLSSGGGGSSSPRAQLELADALNEAIFGACWARHGDVGRFVSTAFVARDLEQIRVALGEDDVSGYFVSYGTGIGQTFANMFPQSVGRMVLDGTEYVRDHRLLGGFGWTALDNGTDAWNDGFLGECINAGPEHCALAQPPRNSKSVSVAELKTRMRSLIESLITRPVPAYTESSGPSLVTYSALVNYIYQAMYNAYNWPRLAQILHDLELGNATLAATALEEAFWEYDPTRAAGASFPKVSSDELELLVICADAYDAPQPGDGLDWWLELWTNMTEKSWVAGNDRFRAVFPCRHFNTYWPEPAEVYRGDLNHTLKHPVLLIAEVYDPATPLRNGRRLLHEMGDNARLIVHHGYGHSSRDRSNCTDSIAHDFILHGTLPEESETDCFANEKPYLYGVKVDQDTMADSPIEHPLELPQQIEPLLQADLSPGAEL